MTIASMMFFPHFLRFVLIGGVLYLPTWYSKRFVLNKHKILQYINLTAPLQPEPSTE